MVTEVRARRTHPGWWPPSAGARDRNTCEDATTQAQSIAKTPVVLLPGTERRVLHARSSGREYHVMIARPIGPPPSASGYPILYLLDANAAFGTAVESLGLRCRRPEVTGVAPAVVVGIGYPTEEPIDPVRRTYDLTPPAAALHLPPRPDGTPWPATGGADEFLDFIAQEIKPAVERDFAIDARRQALFGHSFGGLFTLHALFTRPRLFQSYIAASPSIWWNECSVLDEELAFAAAARYQPQDLDVLITVGGCEQELIAAEASGVDREWRAEWKRHNRMVDNARELAARLAGLAAHGARVTFNAFDGEDHVSVIPAAISRAIGFALGLR